MTTIRPSTMRAPSRRALALAVPAALLVLLGAPVLVLPPGRDQAIFALVGEIIARGGMPYADAFDFKPPGVHLIYALASLGGAVMTAAHALELLALVVAAWALFRLVEPHGRLAAGVAASHLVAAYLGTLRYWDLAQPEGFALPFVLGGLLLFREAGARTSRIVLAGVLFGAAALLKYPLALFALLLPLLWRDAPASSRTDPGEIVIAARRPLATAASLASGLALPLVGAGLYLAIGGAMGAFWSIQTEYLPGYSALVLLDGPGPAIRESWAITRAFFVERPLLVWPPLVGLALGLAAPPRTRLALPLGGALIAVATLAVQGKFFHYHFIPLLPFLAWLTGIGVERIRAGLAGRPREGAIAAVLLVVLAALALARSMDPVAAERVPAVRRLAGAIDRETFRSSPAFGVPGRGDHALIATTEVAGEVRRLARPDDRLFVWGFEPGIYLESGVAPASRFIYTAAFISPWCPRAWSEEMVRDLTGDPPEIFVVASRDAIPWVTGVPLDSREALRHYPAIVELLRSRYAMSGRIERFTLFTRLSPSEATGSRAAP